MYNRKIDQLEGKKATVYCTNKRVYTGTGIIPCQGDDGNGNDVDGILFTTSDGEDIIFTENEIKSIEIID